MNELLDAARSEDEKDSSSERYESLKKKEAGNDETEAEKRFRKLKEEAKEEFIERQREREQEEDEEEEEAADSGEFVTY